MHFEPLRDVIRERAQALATSAGIESEQIAKAHIRKEDAVAQVFKGRGDHPGLVHILSAMGVPKLQALARQGQRQDLSEARYR